jgi:ubiquinone/menaquinone biosynthesis C-methylase UbiE
VFQRVLQERLGIGLGGLTVLNCGCGGGFEAQFLAQQGARVTGFDISQLRAEAAATRFHYHGLDGFFYRGDASQLPFPDDHFDLVLYHDSLHHVPIEEIPGAIREAIRVAKRAVVLLEAHDSPLRMFLESLGLSTSIEPSGNYVFRFRRSLMEFFARRTGTRLLAYRVSFTKKEHWPRYYAIPIAGDLLYWTVRLVGFFLRPLGNEACIILGKTEAGKGGHRSGIS